PCKHAKNDPSLTQDKLAKDFEIGRSTVSVILPESNKWLPVDETLQNIMNEYYEETITTEDYINCDSTYEIEAMPGLEEIIADRLLDSLQELMSQSFREAK
ncbi:4030_t:CDS:2, partial [Entrophospora sp. SA101]